MSLLILLISVWLWKYKICRFAWNMPEVYNPALLAISLAFLAGLAGALDVLYLVEQLGLEK